MVRNNVMYRSMQSALTTRDGETNEAPVIEGYFAVFDSDYDMGYGMS